MYPDRQNADGSVPYIEMDVVEYDDAAPWPDGAAGQGMALHRIDPSAFGNDPINWRAGNDLENSHRVFIPLFP